MSADFKTELNAKVKEDFDACVVNTYNRIVEIIQDEIREGESKISIKLVAGYNPFNDYCDISFGHALMDSVDYWKREFGNGKSVKTLAKQVNGYDLYYRDSTYVGWHFALYGLFGLNKTGKLFAESLQELAQKDNIILKGFTPAKAINMPTLIEFKCQYSDSKKNSTPKKHETFKMKEAIEKADEAVNNFLEETNCDSINTNSVDTLKIYNFCMTREEREYKAQISAECYAKEIVLTENICIGKYHVEKKKELLKLCENYNSDADESEFQLSCYDDKSLWLSKQAYVEFNCQGYEEKFLKELSALKTIIGERIFKVCLDYVE